MDVTLCTTIVSRWEKLDRCLQAVSEGSLNPSRILVLDNSKSPGTNSVLQKHDVDTIEVETEIGPSEARHRLSESVDSEGIMFIDADVRPKSRALELLEDHLSNTDYRAVAGIWSDYNRYYRRVGNSMLYDHSGGNVIKKPISYRDVADFDTLTIDFSTPQIMMETDLLKEVSFDPDYKFLYEWWDFFMQMDEIGEQILAVLDAEFVHEPGGYEGEESTRHGDYDKTEDLEYFTQKWGYTPVNSTYDDGTYNPSTVNEYISYILNMADMLQKRKL